MVDGARPNWRAIARKECLMLSPLDIPTQDRFGFENKEGGFVCPKESGPGVNRGR